MALDLGDIFFKLGANTKGIQKAEKDVKEFAKKAEKAEKDVKALDKAATKLGTNTKGIQQADAHVRAFEKSVEKAEKDVKKLDKSTSKLGTNAAGVQKADAHVKAFEKSVEKAETDVKKLDKSTKKLGNTAEKSFKNSSSAISTFGNALAGIGFTLAIKNAIQLADEYKGLQQRIKSATAATGDYAQVSKSLNAISNSTGTALADNVSLFQNLSRTAAELGANNSQVLAFTKTIGQLGSIGGSSAAGMSAGILQLSQGLAAGTLRAEEMNSILENMPEVANRIAKGLSMSTGELRKAVLAGNVLSKDVFNSLLSQAPEINKEFEKIPKKISQSHMELKNSFTELLGNLDETLRITGAISDAFGGIAGKFRFLSDNSKELFAIFKGVFLAFQSQVKTAFEVAGLNVQRLLMKFQVFRAKVSAILGKLWRNVGSGFVKILGNAVAKVASMIEGVTGLGALHEKLSRVSESLYRVAAAEVKSAEHAAAYVEALGDQVSAIEREIILAEIKGSKVTAAAYASIAAATEEAAAAKATANVIKASEAIKQEQYAKTAAAKIAASEARRRADAEKAVTKQKVDTAQPQFDSLVSSLQTEKEAEMAHYEASLEQLKTAEELKLATIIPYQQLRERLDAEHKQRLEDLAQKHGDNISRIAATGALLGVDLTKKAGDMELSEMSSNFKGQVGLLAQHSKSFFKLKKALAIAGALVDAPKAILGSFAFGSSIGGPILGGIFAGVAAAATAVQIAAISSAQFQGGKAVGGNVFAGGMYKVNEQGPEMLSVGGSDFLMMGSQSGTVTPNHKLGGGGGGTNVNVNVYPIAGETAKISSRETGSGLEIDVIIEQLEEGIASGVERGGSVLSNTLESQYGLNRVAGAHL